MSVRPRSLWLKKRLNKEDSSTRPVLRLPVLREKPDSKKQEEKLRPEDLLTRLKFRDKEMKKRPDTKHGVLNKRGLESKPKRLSRLESLRRRLPESLGRRTKNVSDSKDALLLNKLELKEKTVKLRPELDLRLNARKERPNLNNGESKEKGRLRPEESSKKI